MDAGLYWLGSLCSANTVAQGGLLFGLFAAGAAGSVTHCGPMCGAFVLGQVSDRMAGWPASRFCERRRISAGLLLPYHLGRLTTYAGLGALAAGSTAVFGHAAWVSWLTTGLLVAAAGLFVMRVAGLTRPTAAPRRWGAVIARFTQLLPRGGAIGEYLVGVALGFLPCGLLYAAIIAAAASADPVIGAGAMVAFGLGTVPALVVVGVGGQIAGRRWNNAITAAAPVLMAVNAGLLLVLAVQRVW